MAWCQTAAASDLRESAIVKAIKRARPAVVNIRGEKTLTAATALAGQEPGKRVNGMGTGVIIDSRGYILTNLHVVDGVREIQVTTADDKRYVATIAARDQETDLAVIKIDSPQDLAVVPIGTSADLMLGETVIAVGNAYGYPNTITRGIVSELHRSVQVNDTQFYDDLIQTDASINPGNSGGPLLNIDGEMIGVNVAVRAGAQGIGFAIPIDKALAIAAKLLGSGGIQTAWLGVTPSPDEPNEQGITVAAVDRRSPAAKAGLQPGDVITALGSQSVKRSIDFQRAMLGHRSGEVVKVAIQRGGKPLALDATLAEPPEGVVATANPAWEVLGLDVQPMPQKDFRETFHTRYPGGLLVIEVRPDGPAAAQGIRPGDVLVGMHIWETVSLENLSYVLKRPDLSNFSPLKFRLLRGSQEFYGYLPVAMKTAQAQRQ